MADLAPTTVEGAAAEPTQAPAKAVPTADPGHVALVDDEGTVQSVPAENAEAAVQQYGYRPATEAEYETARDGAYGTFKAGVYGAARGASFGVFDPLAVAASRAIYGEQGADLARKELSLAREGHETANMAGEIGGSLVPLMFGAPPVEAAGAVGEGLLARAGARALAGAPRLLAEGMAFGAGNQLTEDTLGNHELTAGKYLAAGLEGGVLNLLLGAGLAAGGGAIADRLAGRGAKALEGKATGALTKEAGAVEKKTAAGWLTEKAEEQAAKGAMPSASLNAAELQKLGKTSEEQMDRMRRVGRTLLDEGITTPTATKATQAERLTRRAAEVGEELGTLRKSLERAAVRPEAETILARIQQEVTLPLGQKAFAWADRQAIAPFLKEIAEKTGTAAEFAADGSLQLGKPTKAFEKFEDLHTLRRALDDKLNSMRVWERTNGAAPGHEELKAIRGIMEDEFERAADAASRELGEDIATKYATTKAKYADLKTAEKWATKGAARDAQNRAISLTDTIMAGGAIAAGHGVLGVLAPVGNKLVRTYGNQTAAYVLDRVAKLEALQRAAATFDTKLGGSVKAFFGDGPPPASTAKAVKVTPAERQALRAAVSNPAALTEHVAEYAAQTGLHDAAPNVTRALTQSVMRAGALVQKKLPREPSPIGVSFGQKEPRALGPRAQAEMDRALSALDVDKTLDDFANRRLSREQVEAIKFVNPPLFLAMRKAVRDYGQENDPAVSIQQEMALAIMFDTPVSTYTRPGTIRGFQQAFAQGAPPDPAQAGGPQPTPIGSGESKAARSLASPTDRMEASDAL